MERRDFWREVTALSGSVTPFILKRVVVFGLYGAFVWWVANYTHVQTGLGVAPYEIIGAILALVLVLRTNSGYDRWYEGRKLWGGIVNQSRNLGVIGSAYGPDDAAWQNRFLRWTAVFPHLARHTLRGETDFSDIDDLMTAEEIEQLERADHAPLYCSLQVARMLQSARQSEAMDGFAFMRADDQRAQLIDHIGACERILATPLAKVMSIKVRHFIFLYLAVLPLAIVDKSGMLTPFLTMLVAFPLLSLDQIGIELENPFSVRRLSHLPLGDISDKIQRNVMAIENAGDPLLDEEAGDSVVSMQSGRRNFGADGAGTAQQLASTGR
ncbi:bestrophin family protein [Lacipirellula sp.]|uniref:bestrophin family protein n=1 Tax=Lacipirellula sp. TaxID=2691419 RepID=UPI003D0F1205